MWCRRENADRLPHALRDRTVAGGGVLPRDITPPPVAALELP
ncbi:hypothetical protein ACFC96_37220 [Streptomyces sp. NPDC055955]